MTNKEIFSAAERGDLSTLKKSISANDINIIDKRGRNLLFVSKSPEIQRWLIANGIDLFHLDHRGRSVLSYAIIEKRHLSLLTLLKEGLINANIRDKNGRTALGMLEIASLESLQTIGLDINALDDFGTNYDKWPLTRKTKALIAEAGAKEAHTIYLEGCEAASQGRVSFAIERFEKAIAVNKNFAHAYIDLGRILIEAAEFHKAIAALVKANQFKPRFALIYYNLGVALDARGDFKNCIKAYNKAIKLDKAYYEAYLNRATVLLDHRQLKLAERDFKFLLDAKQSDAYLEYNLACLKALKNEDQGALKHLKHALQKGFKDRDILYNDGDLQSIRNLPQFDSLLNQFKI